MMGRKPVCVAPWESIFIAEDRYRPCCRIVSGSYPSPPADADGLMEIVNSPYHRRLRRMLFSGDVAGTVCENCIRAGLNQPELFDYAHVTDPELLRRIGATESAILSGSETLDHPPVNLVFAFPGACNIRCKMCTVHSDSRRGKPRKGNIFVDSAKKLLRSIGGRNLAMLSVGGENRYSIR